MLFYVCSEAVAESNGIFGAQILIAKHIPDDGRVVPQKDHTRQSRLELNGSDNNTQQRKDIVAVVLRELAEQSVGTGVYMKNQGLTNEIFVCQ